MLYTFIYQKGKYELYHIEMDILCSKEKKKSLQTNIVFKIYRNNFQLRKFSVKLWQRSSAEQNILYT